MPEKQYHISGLKKDLEPKLHDDKTLRGIWMPLPQPQTCVAFPSLRALVFPEFSSQHPVPKSPREGLGPTPPARGKTWERAVGGEGPGRAAGGWPGAEPPAAEQPSQRPNHQDSRLAPKRCRGPFSHGRPVTHFSPVPLKHQYSNPLNHRVLLCQD